MTLIWKDQAGDMVTRVGPFTLNAAKTREMVGRDPSKPFDAYIWRGGVVVASSCEFPTMVEAQQRTYSLLREYLAAERKMFGEVERNLTEVGT